ncbi:MAG: RNA-binding S4 domain-containing protein [Candidatus Eisenbacteria sp.]|nr:RNA-binding S4 domain-containing protein [Candidatus Eisenbacteria bacterium]
MEAEPIEIHSPQIRLDALLKFAGVVGTGGEAKAWIQAGQVRVNETPETRRGRKLGPGDVVELLSSDGEVEAKLEIRGAVGPEATPSDPAP